MSVLLSRSVLPGGLDFELERNTFGIHQSRNGTMEMVGLVLAEQIIEAGCPYAAVEHWFLFSTYEPPRFNLAPPDTVVQVRPIHPSQIAASLSQFDAQGDVPASLFESTVRAQYPVATYLKANVQRIGT